MIAAAMFAAVAKNGWRVNLDELLPRPGVFHVTQTVQESGASWAIIGILGAHDRDCDLYPEPPSILFPEAPIIASHRDSSYLWITMLPPLMTCGLALSRVSGALGTLS
jgi:hypothetical protein